MANVTNLTFAIGESAAAAVRRQLRQTRPAESVRPQNERLGDLIYRKLGDSHGGFEIESQFLRLIWRSSESQAGILYVIQDERISMINLLLNRGAPAESAEMRSLADAFRSIAGYRRCLELVRIAPRPLIASFCCADCRPDPAAESALFTFAAVFFEFGSA